MDANTGISNGFGFVEMSAENEEEAAIAALHSTKINKSKIRVKPSTQN
jgi:RNA recognition motif-containing protein